MVLREGTSLRLELEKVRERLDEAQETLRAIRQGEVDAIVVAGPEGDQVYTLTGADQPYRLLLEDMNEGAATVSKEGVILFANRRLSTMLRTPLEAISGTDLFRWLPPGIEASLRASFEGRSSEGWRRETHLLPHQGPPVPVSLALSAFRTQGERCFGIVVTDLTQQKQTEERFRETARRLAEAQEAGHVGSWERNVATGMTTVSAEMSRIFGRPEADLSSVPSLLACIHPEDRDQIDAAIRGERAVETEVRIIRPDAETRWVFVRGGVLSRNAPVSPRFILTAVDVTERRNAEQARRENVERLHEIERLRLVGEARRQMLFALAHELNTPLTPILIQLDLLAAQGQGTPTEQRSIDVLRRNVHRLSRLVQDVLDVARLDTGKLGINPQTVDVATVLNEVAESMQPAATKARVTLVTTCRGALAVEADPRRIQQVVLNLLTNALKFTPPGGSIRLGASRVGGEVVITVTDTGVGLTPEQIPRLFQPFSQADQPGSRKVGGTGLGLFISKGLVEEHGGRIWCDSPGLGRGATFGFALPASKRHPAAQVRPGRGAAASPAASPGTAAGPDVADGTASNGAASNAASNGASNGGAPSSLESRPPLQGIAATVRSVDTGDPRT